MASMASIPQATDAPQCLHCESQPGPSYGSRQKSLSQSHGSWIEPQYIKCIDPPEVALEKTTGLLSHSIHFPRSCQRQKSIILVSTRLLFHVSNFPVIVSLVPAPVTTIHHGGWLDSHSFLLCQCAIMPKDFQNK